MRLLLLLTLFIYSCSEPTNKSVPEKKKKDLNVTESKPTQKKEEVFDILHFLVDEEAKGVSKKKIDYQNHSVSFSNDDDPYSVSFSKIASEDLNKDGVRDYIIYRESEGMLGGNMHTNSEIKYLIMGADNQILQKHEITAYAPFSYNILEDIDYKNGKLKANAIQNFRTYFPEEGEELKSTNLSFIYTNGNVYEESYLSDCELAKWKNKRLFKGNSEVTKTIDGHNYTETIIERYHSGEFEVSVEFSGCDNLSLVLETSIRLHGNKKKEIADKRNQFLEFLKKYTTRISEELEIIQQYCLEHELTNEYTELDNLSFNLYTEQEKGKTIFRLIINQKKNPEQTENWEITTRLKMED